MGGVFFHGQAETETAAVVQIQILNGDVRNFDSVNKRSLLVYDK